MVSESGAIIGRLVAAGANYQTIGEALGRNRSLVRQVAIGAKPGRNLEASLEALERRLGGLTPAEVKATRGQAAAAVVPAPARRTSRGHLARVRKPVTVRGRSWSASTIKRQGVAGGARGLGHPIADAADSGRRVAATVSVDGHLGVEAYGKTKASAGGLHGSTEFMLGDGLTVAENLEAFGGDVTAMIADHLVSEGLVSSDDAAYVAEHIVDIELRTFD